MRSAPERAQVDFLNGRAVTGVFMDLFRILVAGGNRLTGVLPYIHEEGT